MGSDAMAHGSISELSTMPAMGHSRHFDSAPRTSTLPRSADIADRVRQFRKVPKHKVAVLQPAAREQEPRGR